jgi:folate-binding protein YgfZ
MSHPWSTVHLETLGALRVSGADVVSFLQGQLSNDIARLAPGRSLLAGFHNPQGRVIALLRLVELSPGEVLAILPRELAAAVASRLAKFVLRAKVKVADESAGWQLTGLIAPAEPASARAPFADELPQALHGAARLEGSIAVRVGAVPARWLLLCPTANTLPPPAALRDAAPVGADAWQRLSVAAGEPEVFAATSEEFVGQMLNLDAVGAIAFDKGCYTGQEVIARAHYRGRIKRRLQRFVTLAPARLSPGEAGALADGRSFRIVNAAPLEDGRCEFLAVTPLAAGEGQAPAAEDGARPAAHAARTSPIEAHPLPLPYPLPE